MKLTKKIKASIFAWAVHSGVWDFFDRCEWMPHLHKYRYVSAQEDKVYYVSQKAFVDNFDSIFDDEEREEWTNAYLAEMKGAN